MWALDATKPSRKPRGDNRLISGHTALSSLLPGFEKNTFFSNIDVTKPSRTPGGDNRGRILRASLCSLLPGFEKPTKAKKKNDDSVWEPPTFSGSPEKVLKTIVLFYPPHPFRKVGIIYLVLNAQCGRKIIPRKTGHAGYKLLY